MLLAGAAGSAVKFDGGFGEHSPSGGGSFSWLEQLWVWRRRSLFKNLSNRSLRSLRGLKSSTTCSYCGLRLLLSLCYWWGVVSLNYPHAELGINQWQDGMIMMDNLRAPLHGAAQQISYISFVTLSLLLKGPLPVINQWCKRSTKVSVSHRVAMAKVGCTAEMGRGGTVCILKS